MKIGIDFDRVLFRTDDFKQLLFDEIQGFGETYEEAMENGYYNAEKHAEILGIDKDRIYKLLGRAEEYLYSDVNRLEDFPDEWTLLIVSRGSEAFQEMKIRNSGILKYFESFEIVQEEPKDIVEIDFLVDDTERELENVAVPGMLFDREKHSVIDIVPEVKKADG